MKSGTHLVKEFMTALGYGVYGNVRVTPESKPKLDADTRWRVAAMVYDDDQLAGMKSQPESVFIDATDRAWEALAWSWQLRFGMPLIPMYSTELINTGLVRQASLRAAGSRFAETPSGVAWMFHKFDIRQIDGAFLREWAQTGEPRIIFHYRDPRDTVLSLVNYLCGRTREGISSVNHLPVFGRLLMAKESLEERLAYALVDDSFPCQPADFKSLLWLLHHPDVCTTSFEELVGPNGGGSAESQLRATERLINFLGVTDCSAEEVVGNLFNRDAFSFFQGQIGGWRKAFTAEHRRLADDRFGEILSLYGYI
jgi:hypothetical protein